MDTFSSNSKILITISMSCILLGCDGNEDQSVVSEDTTAVVLVSTPADITTDPFARFEFHADDATAIECSIDSHDFETCDSPLQLPLQNKEGLYNKLEPGVHTLQLRARAADGSFSNTTEFRWEIRSIFETLSADFDSLRLIDGEVLPLLSSEADAGWKGIFRINCEFDRAAYDDPIVFPGMAGMAHLHMFWGAKNVNANTDFDSLIRSPEAGCSGGVLNRSAYWFPALLAPKFNRVTGQREIDEAGDPAWEVVMAKVGEGEEGSRDAADAHEVFYYSAAIDDLAAIQSPPMGLRIIAGDNSTQPGQQQSYSVSRWHCRSWNSSDSNGGPWSATIPECKIGTDASDNVVGDMLRFDIFFPSCWNGIDIDSPNHKDHMAYPVSDGGALHCPESHPIPVARVSFHYSFHVLPSQVDPKTNASTGWRLASDNYTVENSNGGLSLHGDWFNGWHPEAMDALVQHCIHGGRDCHDGNFAWIDDSAWNGSVSLGRLINAAGTGEIPEIINGGMGSGHSH